MAIAEGSNQPTKMSKFEETLEVEDNQVEEKDLISSLPDALILHILSRLPSTKDAIKTGTLSKRWKSLWTSIPNLAFKQNLSMWPSLSLPTSTFVSFVNKTLTQCRHLKLKEFRVFIKYDNQFQSQINNWIRYAMSRKVEVLDIMLFDFQPRSTCVLIQQFFIDSCFTNLKLAGFVFNPNSAIRWKMLRSLCITGAKLEEDLIENMLSGSPVLETLVLRTCYGYKRLDITSKSVKSLVICGYENPTRDEDDDVIEINAPNILSLEIVWVLFLWKLSLRNVSSLVMAELDYEQCGYCGRDGEEAKEEMFKGFMQSLRHVKELKVGRYCSEVVSRMEAKGFSFPSNTRFSDSTSPWSFDCDPHASLESRD